MCVFYPQNLIRLRIRFRKSESNKAEQDTGRSKNIAIDLFLVVSKLIINLILNLVFVVSVVTRRKRIEQ